MQHPQGLKPSEASATGSHTRLFLKARIKLTALYVGIITVIVIGFSIFLYQSAVINFAEVYEIGEEAQTPALQRAFDAASHKLLSTLIFTDSIIIFLTALVGYFLAKQTLRPVEDSHEAQWLFAANASHELRTPLAIMKNDIEVLLRDVEPERAQVQKTLSSNLEEIENMSSLIHDLLLLARSDQKQHQHEHSNLKSIIEQTVEKMRPIAQEKAITLGINNTTVCTVSVPEKVLSRALINIIDNSLKYTQQGGTVVVRVTKDTDRAHIAVIDTGEGIAPDELPHIFNRFYRGKSNSLETGTGLGLAIVKESIEQHGGTVSAQGELGKGTTVTITAPLA